MIPLSLSSETLSAQAVMRPSANSSTRKPKGYWTDATNRQIFFKEFAQEHGIDLSQPQEWKNVTNAQVMAKTVYCLK